MLNNAPTTFCSIFHSNSCKVTESSIVLCCECEVCYHRIILYHLICF